MLNGVRLTDIASTFDFPLIALHYVLFTSVFYHTCFRATILQIAVADHIYIVDIESANLNHTLLREFFTLMFLRKEILKIGIIFILAFMHYYSGFQFGEDLLQLRNAVANCKALYHPERVVCVGRLVADVSIIQNFKYDVYSYWI